MRYGAQPALVPTAVGHSARPGILASNVNAGTASSEFFCCAVHYLPCARHYLLSSRKAVRLISTVFAFPFQPCESHHSCFESQQGENQFAESHGKTLV